MHPLTLLLAILILAVGYGFGGRQGLGIAALIEIIVYFAYGTG